MKCTISPLDRGFLLRCGLRGLRITREAVAREEHFGDSRAILAEIHISGVDGRLRRCMP